MNENFSEVQEYLLHLRREKSALLDHLRQTGRLADYIMNMNMQMMEKYPEMITHVYTREEIDDGRGGNQ